MKTAKPKRLTIEKVSALPAGCKLDAMCAKAMGLDYFIAKTGMVCLHSDTMRGVSHVFLPSADLIHAWRLITHVSQKYWARVMTPFSPDGDSWNKHYAGFTQRLAIPRLSQFAERSCCSRTTWRRCDCCPRPARRRTGKGDVMSKLGKRIVSSLEEFVRDAKAGKSFRQSIVRRMKVKGKIVYARETFEAPMRNTPGDDRRDSGRPQG
jgi:hypothetical protein